MLVAQSCLTLRDPVDHGPPGSSVHGILRARILEWVAIPFSRGSSWPRDPWSLALQAELYLLSHLGAPWTPALTAPPAGQRGPLSRRLLPPLQVLSRAGSKASSAVHLTTCLQPKMSSRGTLAGVCKEDRGEGERCTDSSPRVPRKSEVGQEAASGGTRIWGCKDTTDRARAVDGSRGQTQERWAPGRLETNQDQTAQVLLCPSFLSLWSFNTALCIFSFPGGSDGKESACHSGDLGSIPGLRRSLEEGNGNLLQILPREYHRRRSLICYPPWLSNKHFPFVHLQWGKGRDRFISCFWLF